MYICAQSLQKQKEEGMCMHDILTESNLNEKLKTLGKMDHTHTLCKDCKYFTWSTKQKSITNYTESEGWSLEFIISFPYA